MAGTLFLLPCPIAEDTRDAVLPAEVIAVARRLTYFLAENAKATRAFLKNIGHPQPMRELDIVEIGHAPDGRAIEDWLKPVAIGRDTA